MSGFTLTQQGCLMIRFLICATMGCGLTPSFGQTTQGPSTHIMDKFSLVSRWCDEGQTRACATHSPTLPTEQHAQQLSVYDTPQTPTLAPGQPLTPRAALQQSGRAQNLNEQINRAAQQYQIDPLLLHAIAHVESRHNPHAISQAGALGLMQVMPATAQRFGIRSPHSALHNASTNLEVSCSYLKTLQKRFNNNLTLVIAAYNAGEGAVEKYGRKVPPYKETQGYVRDVTARYKALREEQKP
jgi:Transglycosylase SLT domain